MRFLSRHKFLKQLSDLNIMKPNHVNTILTKQFMSIVSTNRQVFRNTNKLSTFTCVYSSDNKKNFINLEKKAEVIKDVFEQKKEQLKDTEHKIRERGEQILKDIKYQKEVTGQIFREKKDHIFKDLLETKAKVKERLGVVERENVYTIPNILCMARIAMSPYLGYVILQDNYNLALGLLLLAGITDLLDGWIARNWEGQSTKMGSFLDPMADKVLIATLFVTLTWQNLIPISLTMLIVARDLALVAAGFIIRYMSLPPPRTLSRYFDVTYATAQLEPTFISKVNTFIQLILVGTTLASPVFGFVDHPAMTALCGVTAASTIASAVSYLVNKNTYKFLKKKS